MLKATYHQPLLILLLLLTPLRVYQLSTDTTHEVVRLAPVITSPSSPAPNFTLNVYPLAQTVYLGSKVTFSIGVTSQNGFTGQVTLEVRNLPAFLLLITGFDHKILILPANGSANSTLTVDAINAGEENFTEFLVVASSGSLTSQVHVDLTILAGVTPPTPISYAFLAAILLFSAFIIWYGLRSRRDHPQNENTYEGPKPPPV